MRKLKMFFILNLILIIILNITYAYITQDSEIVLLPVWNPSGAKEISLTLKVFGKVMQLNLRRNNQIVLPVFEIWENDTKNVTEKLSTLEASKVCFYLHKDHVSSAAINFCQKHGWKGLVFLENDTLEIRPLSIDDFCVTKQINQSFGEPHIINRLQYFVDADQNYLHNIGKRHYTFSKLNVDEINERPKERESYTIELAVFVDAEAYGMFMPFLSDIRNIRNMMFVFVNNIQAYFYHPSLGVRIAILLVRLVIMKTPPSNLPIYSDNSSAMLDSFCLYARRLNYQNDDNPCHWDIALYVSGMPIEEPRYRLFGIAMPFFYMTRLGVSNVDGMCKPDLSCALVKFSSNDVQNFGIFPSLTAAHEIGHALGLIHDVSREENSDLYIMSPKPDFINYKLTWSLQSRKLLWLGNKMCLHDRMESQNLEKLLRLDLPGREQTAKAQCELFLHDEDANVVTLHDICQYLQCETPHKNKFYSAGRPLNGTYCAYKKECFNGKCVPVIEPPCIVNYFEEDIWSEWKVDSCKSSCLEKSKGVLVMRRSCKHGTQRTANCKGLYYDVVFCEDSTFCKGKRKTIYEFTTTRCTEVSKLPNMEKFSGQGYPYLSSHSTLQPWSACTIDCGIKPFTDSYQSLREEILNGSSMVDPYFPDGTWCYNKDGQDYYCRQHYCLPENYLFHKKEEIFEQ